MTENIQIFFGSGKWSEPMTEVEKLKSRIAGLKEQLDHALKANREFNDGSHKDHATITQLQAQLVEKAAEGERLREAALLFLEQPRDIDLTIDIKGAEDFINAANDFIDSQAPSPGFGERALEVVNWAMKRYKFKPGFDVFNIESPLDEACAAFTEDLKMMGVRE